MLLSVEATLVGGLLRLFSQYRTDRGWHPTARARSACVSPASIRAARIWRPETMLLITRLYIRFWKRRHRSSRFIESKPGHTLTCLCNGDGAGCSTEAELRYLLPHPHQARSDVDR